MRGLLQQTGPRQVLLARGRLQEQRRGGEGRQGRALEGRGHGRGCQKENLPRLKKSLSWMGIWKQVLEGDR